MAGERAPARTHTHIHAQKQRTEADFQLFRPTKDIVRKVCNVIHSILWMCVAHNIDIIYRHTHTHRDRHSEIFLKLFACVSVNDRQWQMCAGEKLESLI